MQDREQHDSEKRDSEKREQPSVRCPTLLQPRCRQTKVELARLIVNLINLGSFEVELFGVVGKARIEYGEPGAILRRVHSGGMRDRSA